MAAALCPSSRRRSLDESPGFACVSPPRPEPDCSHSAQSPPVTPTPRRASRGLAVGAVAPRAVTVRMGRMKRRLTPERVRELIAGLETARAPLGDESLRKDLVAGLHDLSDHHAAVDDLLETRSYLLDRDLMLEAVQ